MSFLFWAFGLGALAVAFPILFHLIRRQPQGQMEFSSLMFLRPTPPRISRRSRVENWLLLLLRAAALVLIALAFMRPFLPDTARLIDNRLVPRRVAVVIDSSASMHRSGVLEALRSELPKFIDSFETTDEFALYTCDRSVETIVPFPASDAKEAAVNRDSILQAIKEWKPGWKRAELAKSLTTIAQQLLLTNEENANENGLSHLQIVLVSDMQLPDDWGQLHAFQWPENVKLETLVLKPSTQTDARLQWVGGNSDDTTTAGKLRITNSEASKDAAFSIDWLPQGSINDSVFSDRDKANSIQLQVAPGMNQTVAIPDSFAQGAGRFQLAGDRDLFGNDFYAVNSVSRIVPIYYLTDSETDNPNDPPFYLKNALPESELTRYQLSTFGTEDTSWIEKIVESSSGIDSQDRCETIFVGRSLNDIERTAIQVFVEQGGRCVLTLTDAKLADPKLVKSLGALAGISEVKPWTGDNRSRYLLLGDLDFSHWLLGPFRDASFNDFTKVRFWNALDCDLKDEKSEGIELKIVASFDNGAPAIWERRPESTTEGSFVCVAFGWQPDSSQFALSTKFVPFAAQIVERTQSNNIGSTAWAGDQIELNSALGFDVQSLVRIEGQQQNTIPLETKSNNDAAQALFIAEQPGLYLARSSDQQTRFFAVNVDPREYALEKLTEEDFSTVNIPLGRHPSEKQQKETNRLKKDMELETGQKLWKWLIAIAMTLLIAEMIVAGRTARRSQLFAITAGNNDR